MPVASYSTHEAEEYLNAVWEAYRLTGPAHILPGVLKQKMKIEEAQKGRKEDLDLLHKYEHFLLRVGRNLQDRTGFDPIRLINLARELDDSDALGRYGGRHQRPDRLAGAPELLQPPETRRPDQRPAPATSPPFWSFSSSAN